MAVGRIDEVGGRHALQVAGLAHERVPVILALEGDVVFEVKEVPQPVPLAGEERQQALARDERVALHRGS